MGCCKALGKECSIQKLGLRYHDSRAFTDAPGLPRPLFAFLRLIYAALAIADLVWIGLEHPSGIWVIHLQNWSRVMTALYFLTGSLTAFHRSACGSKENDSYDIIHPDFPDHTGDSNSCALKPGEKDDSNDPDTYENHLSWHHKVLWVLHTLASNSTFVCMIAYFAFFVDEHVTYIWIFYIPRHSLYVFLMIVDTLASYIPVRLLHVVYAYIFGAAYVVFTVVFILTEVRVDLRLNPIMYPSLESGDEPLIYTAYLSIFLIAGFPVAQIIYFLIHKFRTWYISR